MGPGALSLAADQPATTGPRSEDTTVDHARELAELPSVMVDLSDAGQFVTLTRREADQVWRAVTDAARWVDNLERRFGRDVVIDQLPNGSNGRLGLHNAADVLIRALNLPAVPEPPVEPCDDECPACSDGDHGACERNCHDGGS